MEALTVEFGERIWEFIEDGKYRNKASNMGKPQFYRFDKPEAEEYPKMVQSDMELFLEGLDADPFDCNILKKYGLSNEEVKDKLRDVYTA